MKSPALMDAAQPALIATSHFLLLWIIEHCVRGEQRECKRQNTRKSTVTC